MALTTAAVFPRFDIEASASSPVSIATLIVTGSGWVDRAQNTPLRRRDSSLSIQPSQFPIAMLSWGLLFEARTNP